MARLLTRALVAEDGPVRASVPFGRPVALQEGRFALFAPGSVFAHEVRDSRGGGPDRCRLAVLRSPFPGEDAVGLPGIDPGAEILLCVTGKGRAQRALREFGRMQRLGIDPADASPAWMRGLGALLEAGLAPRPYTEAQHQAHAALLRAGP